MPELDGFMPTLRIKGLNGHVPYSPDLDAVHLRELTARDEQRLLNYELFEVDRLSPLAGEAKDGPLKFFGPR